MELSFLSDHGDEGRRTRTRLLIAGTNLPFEKDRAQNESLDRPLLQKW
jgi:hypothetical protein